MFTKLMKKLIDNIKQYIYFKKMQSHGYCFVNSIEKVLIWIPFYV